MRRSVWTTWIGGVLACAGGAWAAELSAGHLVMRPGAQAAVVVSGRIAGESTFGVTIMLELVPRSDSAGTLAFTAGVRGLSQPRPRFEVGGAIGRTQYVTLAPVPLIAVDIAQAGDPWPGMGSFSRFDVDQTDNPMLNGSVDDNGTFLAAPVVYSGPLSTFPVQAAGDAEGVWDVLLSSGESDWEGVATTLVGGTITVTRSACSATADCDDGDSCTDDVCSAGRCTNTRTSATCVDVDSKGEPGRGRSAALDAANGEQNGESVRPR